MKTYKEILAEENEIIKLKPAKNDQEIYDRIELLKKKGIKALSGSRNQKTDILVDTKNLKKAKEILKKFI